jgi:hypothetical protein
VQLSVGNVTAPTGSTISVPASLSSDTNIVAAQYDVLFNSTALNSSDSTPGNVQPNHSVSSSLVSPTARRVVLYSSANAALTNGVLANLIFSVATNAPLGVTSLTLTNVIFSNAQGNRVQPVTLVPGLITISPAPGIFDSVVLSTNGVVQFQITGTPNISYIIQASANLQQWTDASTNIAIGGIINFVDPQANQFRYRFYRVKLGQ